MAEKRVQKRHRKRLQVRYGTDNLGRVGFTEDLSEGGFFLKGTVIHPPRTLLKIEMTGTRGDIILLQGVVRWAKKIPPSLIHKMKAGMGVQIVSFHYGEESFRALLEEMKTRG